MLYMLLIMGLIICSLKEKVCKCFPIKAKSSTVEKKLMQ